MATKEYKREWSKKHKTQTRAYVQKWYRKNWKKRYMTTKLSGAQRAKRLVQVAIRDGILKSLKKNVVICVDCKVERAHQYDHRDYNYPLQVEPVCGKCNYKRGKALPLIIGGLR